MDWIEITVTLAAEPRDWSYPVSVLHDLGCPSSRQESNPPRIVTSLINLPGVEKVVEEIRQAKDALGAVSIETAVIKDEDWVEMFRQNFSRRQIGDRLMVLPTWDSDPVPEGMITLRLDPGQAFGTGEHPTTQMCLELLERANPAGKPIADFGCGSGILAIAAKKLGADRVVGFDIEPASVEAAKANAVLNAADVLFFEADHPDAAAEFGPFRIVLSNIISAALIRFAPTIVPLLTADGWWIVSGVIPANWPDVEAAVVRSGFELIEKREDSGWIAATFRRKL